MYNRNRAKAGRLDRAVPTPIWPLLEASTGPPWEESAAIRARKMPLGSRACSTPPEQARHGNEKEEEGTVKEEATATTKIA